MTENKYKGSCGRDVFIGSQSSVISRQWSVWISKTGGSDILFAGDSDSFGEPADLGSSGFQQGAGDSADRGSSGKSLGYRVKGSGGKVGRVEDREDGIPTLRLEFRFKRIQPVKVIEPFAMRPHPRKQASQPERIILLRNCGAARQGREAERYVITFLIGHRADGGVNHQFRRPVRRPAAANYLFDQPTV